MRNNIPYSITEKLALLEKRYRLLNYYQSDDEGSKERLLMLKKGCLAKIQYYQDIALVLSFSSERRQAQK